MYTKNLNPANIFMKFFRFSDFQVLFGLFRTTQDTIFFIFVVDAFPIFAALGTEIEVAMKVENEHLAEIPHLGVLCVRSKSGGKANWLSAQYEEYRTRWYPAEETKYVEGKRNKSESGGNL